MIKKGTLNRFQHRRNPPTQRKTSGSERKRARTNHRQQLQHERARSAGAYSSLGYWLSAIGYSVQRPPHRNRFSYHAFRPGH